MRRKLLWVGGAVLLALLLVGCGKDLPQNTFEPAGPTAQSEKDVLIVPLFIAGIVFVLVEGGIVFIAIKFRHRKGKERMPSQLHGNTRLEIGWTIAPAVMLAVVMVPTISTDLEPRRNRPPARCTSPSRATSGGGASSTRTTT